MCELCVKNSLQQPSSVLSVASATVIDATSLCNGLPKKKDHNAEVIPEGVRVDAMSSLHKDTFRLFCVGDTELCCAFQGLHRRHKIVSLLM